MADSQKFPVAAHTLAYLAHKDARSADRAISSAELATSIPTNPVVVRRVTGMLAKAGLIATRAGANGGAWLLKAPADISLESVLRAVDGCTHLGVTKGGVDGCPVGEQIPDKIREAITAAHEAASASLKKTSVADLLKSCPS